MALDPEAPQTLSKVGEEDSESSTACGQEDLSHAALNTPVSSRTSPGQSRRDTTVSGMVEIFMPSGPRQPSRYSSLAFARSPASSPTPAQAAASECRYMELLQKVIAVARLGAIPNCGARAPLFDTDTGNVNDAYGLQYESQAERDLRVGAAGELYVSKHLSPSSFPYRD